jgi:RNA-directed DNA polymerase
MWNEQLALFEMERWPFLFEWLADRRILRLIRKWLKAGVSKDGKWSKTKLGTPQGAVASPLIANVYLYCLFD